MSEKQTIDIIAPNLSGKGGTETVILYLLNSNVIGKKICFNVLLTGNSSKKNWLNKKKNLKNVTIFRNNSSIIKAIKSAFFYLKTDSDFILSTGPGQTYIAYIIKKIFKKKYKLVSWIHFSVFGAENIEYKYLKYADYHLAISSEIEKQLLSLNIDKNKIKTIFNPVSSCNLKIKKSIDDVLRFVYVGRVQLYDQKNLNEMLQGLTRLKRKWILEIYGNGEIKDVKRAASKLGIEEKLIFHGWVNDPWASIGKSDALLLTSKFEGFGMVLAEAISRGLPCISADCPVGPQDIIKNGVNGYLYEQGNICDFYSKIVMLCGNKNFDDQTKISESINDFYDDKYDYRFLNSMNSFLDNK